MANENIKFGELVPPDLRIQVYQEAIRVIDSGYAVFELFSDNNGMREVRPDYQLCLLLPCLLYQPENWRCVFMEPGNTWIKTSDMFPEIHAWVEEAQKLQPFVDSNSEIMNELRVNVLYGAIYKVKNEK